MGNCSPPQAAPAFLEAGHPAGSPIPWASGSHQPPSPREYVTPEPSWVRPPGLGPTVTSRRRGASLPLTLRVPFLPCQVQQLQQVPVSHVYPSQVQYVEGGDASYTASAM